jgi:biopolymer transport protein ExbD
VFLIVSSWDVFLSDRLELRRGLSTAEVRAAWLKGEIRDDDLVRPSGSNEPWGRLADLSGLHEPESEATAPAIEEEQESASGPIDVSGASLAGDTAGGPPTVRMPELDDEPDDDGDATEADELGTGSAERIAGTFAPVRDEAEEPSGDADETLGDVTQTVPSFFAFDEDDVADEGESEAAPEFPSSVEELPAAAGAAQAASEPAAMGELGGFDLDLAPEASRVSLPVAREPIRWNEPAATVELDAAGPIAEDEEAAEFTLARGATEKVEELDLAAMVDVAFQLVLFFLVTATTVLYKTLEVPKPNPEAASAASPEGAQPAKSLEDLQADYILVEIDPSGTFTVDREPVAADFTTLAERLRQARTQTGRTAMLLTADATTLHRYAVLAYDVANEIGLRIAIAKPGAVRPNAPSPPRPPAAKGGAAG